MSIDIDVVTRLNDRSARQAADEAVHRFDRAGADAGRAYGDRFAVGLNRSTPQIERSFKRIETAQVKVANATSKVTVEQAKYDDVIRSGESDRVKLVTASERLAKARRDEAVAVRNAIRAHQDHDESLRRTARSYDELGASMSRGVSSLAIGGLVPALAVVGASAATAAGSLALLPGAIAGAGAAFGTLKIATLGFGDALDSIRDPEKFAESLQSLSPNAQQAALSIRALMPAFDQLKTVTQDALFNGVGQQLNQLAGQYLPAIQKTTTGIAGAFNQMFAGVANQLMTPETQASMTSFLNNTVTAFQALAPAMAPMTKAFADLMSVGSSFLPGLATAAADAARSFGEFISNAKDSGQLKQWIGDGLDTLRMLGGVVVDVGQAFMALAPVAREILPPLANGLRTTAEFLGEHPHLIWAVVGAFGAWKTIEGVSSLATALGGIGGALRGLPALASTAGTAISGALAAVSVPAWLTFAMKWAPTLGVGAQSDQKNAADLGLPEVKFDAQGRPYMSGTAHDPGNALNVPGYLGGGGSFANPLLGGLPGAQAARRGGIGTTVGQTSPSAVPAYPAGGYAVPLPQQAPGMGGASTSGAGGKLPLGVSVDSFGPAAKSDLNDSIGQIGAQLDQDLGLSKGLPGLMENLTKFVANLAAAPLLGALGAIDKANPNEGSGLMGIMASNGAFGPRFMPSASAIGPAAWQPGYAGGYGGYPGDAALLANVPSGKYQWGGTDLAKGLADCSSSVEDLVNIMDGKSTSGRSLSTANAADWLPAHGFLPGMGGPGDFRVGYNSSHMQATLPGGTPFNWGSDAAAANRGIGGTGAFDPAFTSNYYRPVGPTDPYSAGVGPATGGGFSGQGLVNPGGGFGVGPGAVPGAMGGAIGGGGPTTPYGGFAPKANAGGGFSGLGGAPMDALMGAASAADLMMPGAGAAAKVGIQLANRAIGYAGQVAGIMTGAVGETLLPKGSELAGGGWLSKIAAGIAGARPALPNSAGGAAPQPPKGPQPGAPGGGNIDNSRTMNNTINYTTNRNEERAGKDITAHLNTMNMGAGGGW